MRTRSLGRDGPKVSALGLISGKSESLAPVEMLAAMSSGHLEAGRGTQKTY
jgi:hypothetical protein